MTIEHPTPVVVMAGRHRAFWMVVRLMGVLIALLILPVLIVLNLLLYLVILPAAVQAIIS
jgi:4-hydroxybenzoate polyprenyltransferase